MRLLFFCSFLTACATPQTMQKSHAPELHLWSEARGFISPLDGPVTSGFGARDGGFHYGVDIKAPPGATIIAARSGIVSFAGRQRGYGKIVIVDHGPYGETRYAHCRTLKVRVGQRVRAGQAIATVGATGRATGTHLHFEIRRRNGRAVNPLVLLGTPST